MNGDAMVAAVMSYLLRDTDRDEGVNALDIQSRAETTNTENIINKVMEGKSNLQCELKCCCVTRKETRKIYLNLTSDSLFPFSRQG